MWGKCTILWQIRASEKKVEKKKQILIEMIEMHMPMEK